MVDNKKYVLNTKPIEEILVLEAPDTDKYTEDDYDDKNQMLREKIIDYISGITESMSEEERNIVNEKIRELVKQLYADRKRI